MHNSIITKHEDTLFFLFFIPPYLDLLCFFQTERDSFLSGTIGEVKTKPGSFYGHFFNKYPIYNLIQI